MAALGWLLNLGFAGGGESPAPVVTETFSGGYEERGSYHVFKRKLRLDDDIQEEVKEIIKDVAVRSIEADTTDDRQTLRELEIALRVRLRVQDILYKQLYLSALKKWKAEVERQISIQREDEAIAVLLLL